MVDYTKLGDQLGAELQDLRGIEAAWEWQNLVSGASTYFKDKLNAAYGNTDVNEDRAETSSKESLTLSAVPAIAGAHSARQAAFEQYFFLLLDLIIPTAPADQLSAISYQYDQNLIGSGEVVISNRRGRWGALRRQMILDSQTILMNTVSFGALTAQSGNLGVLADSAISGEDHTLGGTFQFDVVDDTVGAIRIAVSLIMTSALVDGTLTVAADNQVTVGKPFKDGPTGLQITLSLGAVVETGDGGGIFSAQVITSPSEADSAKGKFFFEVERLAVGGGGPHFRVRWFRSGSLLSSDKVAELDITGESGTTNHTMIGAATTITFDFNKTAAATALPSVGNKDSDIVFDIKSPRIGDRWTKTVTNTQAGNFASKIARRWRASLNSVSASPTITDSKAASVAQT